MVDKLRKKLKEAKHIVLLGHRNPDGDAMGSTLALCGVLRNMNKQATVIMPNKYPDNLSWMEGACDVILFDEQQEAALASLSKADFLIALDFNDFSRLGEMEPAIPQGIDYALIDHHPYPGIETELTFSDTTVSSTCEHLTNLLYKMQLDKYIGKEEATALFVGILTDTGRFNHNSSNAQTYRMVANLMEKDVNKDEVIDRVFDSYSEDRMRFMGYVLDQKMQVFPKQELVIVAITLEEKRRYNFQQGDSEGLVNIPLSIKGINRSVFMQENEDCVRMSFRSKGDRPVNKIASDNFEGGGHANAAGATSYLSIEDTEKKVKDIFNVE